MEKEPIKSRLVGIEIVHKNMNPMPKDGIKQEVLFDIRVEVRVAAQQRLVLPYVTVKVKGKDESELASIGVSCLFEIENFDSVIKLNEDGVYHIPKELEAVVTPVGISTTRGVMWSEFRGTYLNNAVMPVVFMTTLQKEKKEANRKE